jgi:hypothetical protein
LERWEDMVCFVFSGRLNVAVGGGED